MNEKNTDTLQQELMSTNNLDRFLTENDASFRDVPLQEAIQRIFDEKGMSKAQLAKQSGISEVYLHQLFSGRRFPSRSRLLCLCFGLDATVDEAQSLLQQARHAPLYSRDRRDAIIIFALSHHMTLFEVNDKLFTENLDTLC
ncbi:MAG: helix-turn-helix transcriptional regulator [Vescimonas sp.]|uniref:helix-turn-helix domain-containing protein n=1 Tax=Vescimonas sp. TaxID=2892404 RepID=UPI001B698A09|nr:helix-turn-helix transcriptional regulator [Vescimonas sp.]MBP3631508.1 helix-turn-helix transcriptional regulator [Oscillospiraceae bacterium]MDY5334701.1 helix-turn-helix transcriptional regulator [Vescimonas sp.]